MAFNFGYVTASLDRARRHAVRSAMVMAATGKRSALILPALLLAFAAPASAESVAEFYKGKTITIAVGVSPGGSFDMYARLLARFIGKHIPGNPDVIVQNLKGGASHLLAAQYLVQTAPKDGTAIGTFTNGIVTEAMLDPSRAAVFDVSKVAFLGSISHDLRACYTWHTLGAKTWDQVLKKEIKYGTGNKSSYSYQAAAVLKHLGANIKIIVGYPGSSERRIAIESGELNAYCGSWVSTPKNWVNDKKVNVFVRFSKNVAKDMPEGVPYVRDLAKTEEDKKIIDLLFAASEASPPYAVSKQVPADRLAALRAAFEATMKDPEFLAAAKKEKRPVNPISWQDTQEIVDEVFKTPPAFIEKAKAVVK